MLTINEIVDTLPAHIVHAANSVHSIEINEIVAGDLMSDILVSVGSNELLVTGLATEQAVRTADIIGAAAVLLVNDKLPTESMRSLAVESDITLLATPLPMYEACVVLANLKLYE